MPTAAPPMTLDLQPARAAGGLADWLRLHRGAVAVAGLLAFTGPVTFFTGALSVMREPTAANIGWLGLWWGLYGTSLWALLLVAGYACERMTPRLGQPLRAAAWFAAACAAAALTHVLTAGRATIVIEQGLVHSARTMHLYGFTFSLVMALLFFAHLRRSREHARAASRLAAAQTAQRHARRRIVEARLQAVQARIDPQLLFELLDTVRRLYASDAARAERFLDELITFLREALPRARAASSSLAREAALARAFARLRGLGDAADVDLDVEVAPDALHARFPPGVLLPLLEGVGGRSGRWRLAGTRADDRCRVTLTLGSAPPDPAIARVRSLLADLHGASGTLHIASRPATVDLAIEVPYELA